MRVKIASIESSITPINFFALFPIDQHLQHEQQQQQQQIGEIQNSRQQNFGRMASYRYFILLVIINLTKTINFTEKSYICELPFPGGRRTC